jgi:hypothetical protein
MLGRSLVIMPTALGSRALQRLSAEAAHPSLFAKRTANQMRGYRTPGV